MKSASNEEECQRELLSSDAEEFGLVIKRDLDSQNGKSGHRSTRTSTKLSQDGYYSTSELLIKDPYQSAVFTQADSFLPSHKDFIKLQEEERQSMNLGGKNSLSIVINIQQNTEDFSNSSPSTIRGPLENSKVIESPRPKTLCFPSTRLDRTAFASADETNFKNQSNFNKQLSLFRKNERNTKRSLWQKCGTPQVRSYDHYKEILDRNFERSRNLDDSQFSYHPEILSKSKKKKPQTPHQMSYEPIKKKQEKIKALRKELMDKANKEYTFAPELMEDAYNRVDSRLKLKNELGTYLERVRKDRIEKEIKQRVHKEMREIEELTECTHTPKTNKCFGRYRK
jgi:ATP-dependent Lon protease